MTILKNAEKGMIIPENIHLVDNLVYEDLRINQIKASEVFWNKDVQILKVII